MGYRAAFLPIEAASDILSARNTYANWPAARVQSSPETERFLSLLLRRWPSVADRPSRFNGSIVSDDDAPFQIDIDGGLLLLEVSWGALATVMPDLRNLASSSGVAMYLPFEGEVVATGEDLNGSPFGHVGRLVLPGDSDDLTEAWVTREQVESADIDALVEGAHAVTASHRRVVEGAGANSLVKPIAHTLHLWSDRVKDVREAGARATFAGEEGVPSSPALAEAGRRIRHQTTKVSNRPPSGHKVRIQVRQTAIVVTVPASMLESTCPIVVGIAGELGLQAFDETAGTLFE